MYKGNSTKTVLTKSENEDALVIFLTKAALTILDCNNSKSNELDIILPHMVDRGSTRLALKMWLSQLFVEFNELSSDKIAKKVARGCIQGVNMVSKNNSDHCIHSHNAIEATLKGLDVDISRWREYKNIRIE